MSVCDHSWNARGGFRECVRCGHTERMPRPATIAPTSHEFTEDVNDASMCICGIPVLTHDEVMPAPLPGGAAVALTEDEEAQSLAREIATKLRGDEPGRREHLRSIDPTWEPFTDDDLRFARVVLESDWLAARLAASAARADLIADERDQAELETMQAKASEANWVAAYDAELVRRKEAEARAEDPRLEKVRAQAEALREAADDALTMYDPPIAECITWSEWLRARADDLAALAPVQAQTEEGERWWGTRLVRGGDPKVCVHNVGLTMGLWCGSCTDLQAAPAQPVSTGPQDEGGEG